MIPFSLSLYGEVPGDDANAVAVREQAMFDALREALVPFADCIASAAGTGATGTVNLLVPVVDVDPATEAGGGVTTHDGAGGIGSPVGGEDGPINPNADEVAEVDHGPDFVAKVPGETYHAYCGRAAEAGFTQVMGESEWNRLNHADQGVDTVG